MKLADEVLALRDKFTVAQPDKPDTPWAVLTRAAEALTQEEDPGQEAPVSKVRRAADDLAATIARIQTLADASSIETGPHEDASAGAQAAVSPTMEECLTFVSGPPEPDERVSVPSPMTWSWGLAESGDEPARLFSLFEVLELLAPGGWEIVTLLNELRAVVQVDLATFVECGAKLDPVTGAPDRSTLDAATAAHVAYLDTLLGRIDRFLDAAPAAEAAK